MEKRYINEIETDLKTILNGVRGVEQAKAFKVILEELKQYFPYTTTKYLKQFIENKQNHKFIIRDFLSKANLTTEAVKGQIKQEWLFVKYETEIKTYMMDKDGKCSIAEIKPLKVGKAYLINVQETYRKIIEKPLSITA